MGCDHADSRGEGGMMANTKQRKETCLQTVRQNNNTALCTWQGLKQVQLNC